MKQKELKIHEFEHRGMSRLKERSGISGSVGFHCKEENQMVNKTRSHFPIYSVKGAQKDC